jgi:hypothetical protein
MPRQPVEAGLFNPGAVVAVGQATTTTTLPIASPMLVAGGDG